MKTKRQSFQKRRNRRPVGALMTSVAVVYGVSVAPGALAQESEDVVVLDTIVVTARKIEEPVQRVPFGVSVFDVDSIDRRRLRDTRSFAGETPGLNFVDTGVRGSNIPNIRGVGSFFPQSSDDASVPVFIDGVPVPVRAQDREFFDIERIEVLRGPQNTLYGRNAQAGAISITTANPTFEPLFEVGGEIGNLGARRAIALANGPLGEQAAGRLAVQYDTRDGDIPDLNLGDDARDQDLVNASGKLLWRPSSATDVTLALRYGNYDEQPTQGAWFENLDFPQLSLDTPQSYELETLGGGLTVRHDFGGATLTSVTGVNHYTADFFADDSDGLVFQALTGFPPALFNDPDADFRTIAEKDILVSQEIRLDGELANGVRWLAGINLFRSELDFDFTFNSTGFIQGDFDNRFTTTSYDGFGEVTIPVTDRLSISGGLRYAHEVRDFEGRFTDRSSGTLGADARETGSQSFDLVTGRAALTYDILPELTAFTSVARGAKAGGFQLADTDVARGFDASRFDPAYTWSYEAGVRGSVFGGALDVSASAFFTDTEGEHVQVSEPLTFQSVIRNIDTQTYGAELEGAVRPATGLTLSGGLTLLETEITGSEDPAVQSGNEIPFAPSLAFNLAAEYERPLAVLGRTGDVFARVEYQYVGARTTDPQNSFDLDSFDLVNLRAGWDSEQLSVYAFVSNLTDNTYAETAFLFGPAADGGRVSVGIPGQPRRFGVGARLRF